MNFFTNKVSVVCAVMALAASGELGAAERSIDEARAIAETFMSNRVPAGSRAAETLHVAQTGESDGNAPIYYIFNNDKAGGFVIVSADDTMRPVLGYSDNGVYDPERAPEALKWWLSQYENVEISSTGSMEVPVNTSDRRSIDPLITTSWDQESPYNLLCPSVLPGISGHAYTGCVATAMAQIVNYHKWPIDGGRGTNSYVSSRQYDVSFDFAAARFDWDNMPAALSIRSTETQINAVNQLMYACGVAIDTQYDRNGGSGTYNALVPEGLREYLCYDPMVRHVYRNAYSDSEWEDLIYNELAEGRPVQYGGYTPEGGGHSFICDGYDENGLYHINWGWGGTSDGFFALSVLDPTQQGAGSSNGGYNRDQDAVIGIQRPVEGSKTFCSLYCDGSVSFDNERTFRLSGWTTNESYNEHTYTLGIIITDNDGKTVKTLQGEDAEITLSGYVRGTGGTYSAKQYVNGQRIVVPAGSFDNLTAGSYRLYPAYRTGNMDWTILPTHDTPHYIAYDVAGTGGIDLVEKSKLDIEVAGANVIIKGARDGDVVTIHDIAGHIVEKTVCHGSIVTIELPARGMYIVACGGTTVKCRL